MVDVLNMLDGREDGFDNRFFITFGNHEFDRKRLHDVWMLGDRVRESHFTWLRSNISFATGRRGTALVAGDNLAESRIIEANGVKVGLFGLTTDIVAPELEFGHQAARQRA